jgi:HK97 gp10 family phage protein
MATRFTNKVAVLKALRNLSPQMRLNIDAAIAVSANQVADKARQFAPVSPGRKGGALKASIRVSKTDSIKLYGGRKVVNPRRQETTTQGLAYYVLAGDDDAFYAHMVEFGTDPHINGGKFAGTQHPGTNPQPFFLPAWRATKKPVRSRISRAVSKAVRQSLAGVR